NALKQSHLRALLASRDRRAYKNPRDLRSVELISQVVTDGLNKGWLKQSRIGYQTGTERIWLGQADSAEQLSSAASQNLSVQPSSKAEDKVLSILSSTASTPAESTSEVPDDKGRRRTQEMIDQLKARHIYSPKAIRDYIFEALQEIDLKQSLAVSTLIR